jgi:hypothetical protein
MKQWKKIAGIEKCTANTIRNPCTSHDVSLPKVHVGGLSLPSSYKTKGEAIKHID